MAELNRWAKKMKRFLLPLIAAFVWSTVAIAGTQQDFFLASVSKATGVRILKIGLDRTPEGAMRHHVLVDSREKKIVQEVAALIEMIDPAPEKREKEEDIWTGSVLSFGVAEYILEFRRGDEVTLSYGMDRSMKFVVPYGGHALQPIELLLDYPLTPKSAKAVKRFVSRLKEAPNQAAQTTPALRASVSDP